MVCGKCTEIQLLQRRKPTVHAVISPSTAKESDSSVVWDGTLQHMIQLHYDVQNGGSGGPVQEVLY